LVEYLDAVVIAPGFIGVIDSLFAVEDDRGGSGDLRLRGHAELFRCGVLPFGGGVGKRAGEERSVQQECATPVQEAQVDQRWIALDVD